MCLPFKDLQIPFKPPSNLDLNLEQTIHFKSHFNTLPNSTNTQNQTFQKSIKMQFHLLSLLALLASANAQLASSLTAAAGSALASKASTALTGAAASYTGPGSGALSSLVSSGVANPSDVASKISSVAGKATSTAAANYNQVAQAGLGAVVAAGLLGVVV